MFRAARSLMFSSLTRMRQLSTSSSVKESYVNNSEEFTERVVNNQRPIVLMFTNKTDYDCLHNEVIMDRAIAATEGTVDLVKLERTRINMYSSGPHNREVIWASLGPLLYPSHSGLHHRALKGGGGTGRAPGWWDGRRSLEVWRKAEGTTFIFFSLRWNIHPTSRRVLCSMASAKLAIYFLQESRSHNVSGSHVSDVLLLDEDVSALDPDSPCVQCAVQW